ncbi:multiple epidermal growth factor-like domains protein 11 isoform X2 [Mytilus edulis]|uniref:multiple epidermal growth factor-like domains protein 11 isoform X2 n=1 Tax=Mytilus edulis TaxID=6550 RepID=UPI0039EF45C8
MYLETIILVHTVLFSRIIAFPNLALNGSAIQSSVYRVYGPSRVIDGNRNQAFYGESCCHTAVGEKSAWWRLDLGYSAYIHRIVIYYRKNRPDRLKGYHLYISNSFKENNPNSGHECSHYPMSMHNPTIIQNKTCDWTGRYIVYYNKREDFNAFVELCEVEVFGCYVGRYGSQCKSRCPVNCNNGTCSIWDGSCASCKEGFKGDRCDQVCDKGTYGINCSTSCTNCKNQSCDHRTGECPTEAGCKAGFHGSKCSKSCSANTYSENCQLQCHCLDGVTCDNVNGQCPDGLCDPGWRSNTCSQKCEVGTYGPNCQNTCDKCKYTECNQLNGTCTHGCSAGWKGPKCEIRCEKGAYGPNCQDTCDNCKDTECNQFNGTCADGCSAGWKGSKCDMRCKNGTYGPNCQDTCDNCQETECNQFNGTCTRGCSAGWKGPKCEIRCENGTYGPNCQDTCDNCKDTECNQFNGTCTDGCSAGWKGSKCDMRCKNGTYGPNCQDTCDNCQETECNQFNGTCTRGCSAGWKGPKCEIRCEKGTYGPNCQDTCDNCKDTECNQFNGTCTDGCSAGWKGSKCDMRCKNGTYGPNCQDTCDNCQETECNQFNGTCTRGCSAGWKGSKCEIRCENGTYGPNCQDTCDNCKDTECNQFNGTCTDGCSAGWKGLKCDMKCENGTYGPNCQDTCDNCKETECNQFNGTCTDGCSAGWKGPKCEITCDKGTYGINCSMSCSNCRNQSCDHRTGICPIDGGCKVGYQGLKCITACNYGTYGTNCQETCDNCKDTECNQFNGTCTHGCSAGWMGPKCAISCSADTYGENCRYECHCFYGKPCDNRNGRCPDGLCGAGWQSNSCNQTCGKGTYGINCSESCRNCINESCDNLNGRCLTQGDCKAGYQGSKCSEETLLPLKIDKGQWIFIGGVVVAILVVIAVILVVVLIYRKRANRTRKPRRGTQFSNELTGNPAYSNDTFESPQYAQVEKENQMSSKGMMVEFGNVSMSEDSDTNDTRPDNLYLNTESTDADNLYSNTEAKNVFSEYNIAVGNLPSVAKMKRKNNAFKKEYAMLPKGLKLPHSEGEREENSKKNRYLTTFPYDHSRVQLDTYDANTDYINANYIKNYSNNKAYIATQGPKKNTLSDFWQMIWQENVDTIIMVTNLMEGDKKKCDQYWPESTHKKVVIGEFTLKMLEERENTVYIYRCIQLACENTDRIVHQFHFTKWPDHDVPDKTNLVNFYRKVKSSPSNGSGPMVVHCSAGVGRTGTFLALDALYEHGNATGFVNIMEYTHMMRQDRMNMIQTVEQYATVYDILVEAFIVPQSAIPKQDFLNMLDSRLIEREYQKLQNLKPVIDANKFQAGKLKENVPKNAVQNLLPHDDYRPYLMSYGRSSNDYINAVKIQSFREGRNIFVTQYPLQNTIGDLWSLVYDNDCRTIVILDELSEDVIPSSTSHRFSNDNFIISRISSNALQDKVTISLRHKNKKEERPITVFVYNDWEDTNMIPNSTKTMIDFTEEISRTTREDNESKIVICRDGCTRCGIYVTLDLVLEKMEIDEEIDILQVARRIQTRRPQFLSNIEQFEFCYCALKELLSSQAVYANSGNLLSVYR